MLHLKSLTFILIVAAQFGPALMLPPPMLRTVCGVVADAEEVVGNQAVAAGKAVGSAIMKPIAIVGGLKAAAVGTGMKIGGSAIRFVGEKMAKDGSILQATGAGIKGAGLGVAALSLKPEAEKIVAAGQAAEGSINAASDAASKFAQQLGDTSVQIDATIDSPILGHHNKNVKVSAGLDTAMNQLAEKTSKHTGQQIEQQVQQVEQIEQQAQQETKSAVKEITKRATRIDTDVFKSALNLVKEAKMEDCVARAICDLNCNPQGFGQDGKQVFMNMVRLQGTNALEASESKYFQEAASKGRSYSGKCDQCSSHYSKCNSKSSDLIKMASHLRMD